MTTGYPMAMTSAGFIEAGAELPGGRRSRVAPPTSPAFLSPVAMETNETIDTQTFCVLKYVYWVLDVYCIHIMHMEVQVPVYVQCLYMAKHTLTNWEISAHSMVQRNWQEL